LSQFGGGGGGEGGPRCRHGTGARRKLKQFIIIEIKITATAGVPQKNKLENQKHLRK